MATVGVTSYEPTFSKVQNYKIRSGTISHGHEYEHKTVALVSLRSLLRFQDFNIAFNADDAGALDDVVVIAQRKGDDGKMNKIKILMQLKHKEKKTDINECQFLDTNLKASYSLLKYYQDVINLKNQLANKPAGSSTILEQLERVDNKTYFVLFTNKNTKNQLFFKPDGLDDISFLNTSDKNTENMFMIDLSKVQTVSGLANPDYNINFSLFAKQSNANHLSNLIKDQMKTVLQQFGLTNIIDIEILENFMKYIYLWCTGNLGGHYFLTKQDVLYKLTELLLSRLQLDLSREVFDFDDCIQKSLWNEVVKDKPITIVDSNGEVIRFLQLYIGSIVRSYCENKKMWCYELSSEEQSSFYKQHANLKNAMLKIVGNFGKLTPLSIYKCLWFRQQLPLLLIVKTVEEYNDVSKILKLCQFNLKVIIINETKSKLTVEEDTSSFVTLSDLSEEIRLKILNCSVKLQGRSSVTLREVVHDSFLGHFSSNAIIDVLLGNYNIGNEFKPLPKYFIEMCLPKVFLKINVLEVLNDQFFLIEVGDKCEDEVRKCLNMLIAEHETKKNIIIFNMDVLKQIDELKTAKKPIHRLKYYSENVIEWKESFGSIKGIRKYISKIEGSRPGENWLCNELQEIFTNNWFNGVHLVSASPGMGKSTLLDYIATKASTDMWVLNVKLIDYYDYYDKVTSKGKSVTAQDHLQHFYTSSLKTHNCTNSELTQAVFQKFLNDNKVLIMLDGFDEVPIPCRDQVAELACCLHQAGYCTLITTRPHLATDLEDKFGTISCTLKPFSFADQKTYLNKYFSHVSKEVNINTEDHQTLMEEFIKKLLRACKDNLHDQFGEFMGIPLQTKMIADAFSSELKSSLQEGTIQFEHRFNLVRLYEKFVEEKDAILHSTLGIGAMNMTKKIRKQQQLFALQHLFSTPFLQRLDINEKLKKFYVNNETKIQFLQQDGLTIIQRNVTNTASKLQVNFVHLTFAEYMAACWLLENFNSKCDQSRWTAKILLQDMLRNYDDIFLIRMFDSMLAKDCSLHLLIISGRLKEAQDLISLDEKIMGMIDVGGRSFLHIIGLYGRYYNKRSVMNFLDDIPTCEEMHIKDKLEHTPLEYAILTYSSDTAHGLFKKLELPIIVTSTWLNVTLNWMVKSSLFRILFPFFICRQLLEEPNLIHKSESIAAYCRTLLLRECRFWKRTKCSKDIIALMRSTRRKTFASFLIELKIRPVTECYYYDLRYAAAFGTALNVVDLMTSEYAISEEPRFNYCTPLCCAIKRNRLDIVQILLFYGEKVDEPCIHQRYHIPVHSAFEKGYIDILNELLSYNANVNVQDVKGNTLLVMAIRNGNLNVAELVLARGKNVNVPNEFGRFPIHYAVENGWNDIIPDLSKGIDINYQESRHHNTLLHVALLNGHLDTAQLLLRNGVDYTLRNKDGDLPLHIAVKAGFHQLLPYILPKTITNELIITNSSCQSLLHLSIKYYKKSGIQVKSADYLNTVSYLLDNGNNANNQDIDGNSPLHYLCHNRKIDNECRKTAFQLLVNKGVDINLKNKFDQIPLHHLIRYTSRDLSKIVPLFISNGVDANIQDIDGNTSMHYLCYNERMELDDKKHVIQLLYDAGADLNLKNKCCKTPLNLSVGHYSGQLSEISTLLNNGALVNIQDIKGNTALHTICYNYNIGAENRKNIVKLLSDRGANINLRNENGKTPLHLIVESTQSYLFQIVTLLVNESENVNIQDAKGNTALHYLCCNCNIETEDRKNAAKFLLDEGADINLKNNNGVSVSNLAQFTEIIALLQ